MSRMMSMMRGLMGGRNGGGMMGGQMPGTPPQAASAPPPGPTEIPIESPAGIPKKEAAGAKRIAEFIWDQYQQGLAVRRPHSLKWLQVQAIMSGIHYYEIKGGTIIPLRPKTGVVRATVKFMEPAYRRELGRLNANDVGVTAVPRTGLNPNAFWRAARAEMIMRQWAEETRLEDTDQLANEHLLYYGMQAHLPYVDKFRQQVFIKSIPGCELFPIPFDAKTWGLTELDGVMRATMVTRAWLEQQDELYERQNGQPPERKMGRLAQSTYTGGHVNLSTYAPSMGQGGRVDGATVIWFWVRPAPPLFPNGATLDDEIRAAQEVGVRFHPTRGSMSLGESQGGLPPDSVVESEPAILADCRRVIEAYHQAERGAMVRVVVAPCSPFSVTPDLMREAAALARAYGVRLHTHLAETIDEERFCLETFGRRPLAHVERLGWAGDDTWFAHAVHVTPDEIGRMAASGSGVAHCPSSNMRLASGIAPARRYRRAGVPVGLGVDGSASNDSSHMLAEARQAMLLSRLGGAVRPELDGETVLLAARQALELATRGGAAVLGRDDIGSLEPGKCADFIALRLDRLGYAGALHDPVAAAVFCAPAAVDVSVVHGRKVVDQGQLIGVDLPVLIENHNRTAAWLVRGE